MTVLSSGALAGKVVLVSGGTQGVGAAAARWALTQVLAEGFLAQVRCAAHRLASGLDALASRHAAIREARRAIDELGKKGEISLVYAGGIRNGGDVAKAIALGADIV